MNKAQSLPSRSLRSSGVTLTLPFPELRSAAAQLLAESDSNLQPFPQAGGREGGLYGSEAWLELVRRTRRVSSGYLQVTFFLPQPPRRSTVLSLQACPLPRDFFFQ